MGLSAKLLTVTEAAAILKLGRTLVYELVLRGDLKSIKIGRARRIPVTALDEFIVREICEQWEPKDRAS